MTAAAKSIPILLALTWAAFLAAKSDRSVEIKFDPARDGPISFEKPWVAVKPSAPGVCLTSLATGTGATGTAVYTPCTMTTSSTSSVLTINGTGTGVALKGGNYVQQR